MSHVITLPCVGSKDGSCVSACPVDSIQEASNCPGDTSQYGDQMLYIDPDVCIDCTACAAVCPMDAIFLEDDVPVEWDSFIDINEVAFTV